MENFNTTGYSLMTKIEHARIIDFLRIYLKQRTTSTIVYWFINLLLLLFLGWKFYSTTLTIDESLTSFSVGIFLCVFLIPVHELIHGLTYRFFGAPSVKYKADIRKFVFYAIADKFIIDAKRFRIVAIAPFVVITLMLAIAYQLVAQSSLEFTILGILSLHTGACSGDFGLMSYLDSTKERDVYTYDDIVAGESYFMEKI